MITSPAQESHSRLDLLCNSRCLTFTHVASLVTISSALNQYVLEMKTNFLGMISEEGSACLQGLFFLACFVVLNYFMILLCLFVTLEFIFRAGSSPNKMVVFIMTVIELAKVLQWWITFFLLYVSILIYIQIQTQRKHETWRENVVGKMGFRNSSLRYYLYAYKPIHLQIVLVKRKENSSALESIHLLSQEAE